MQKKFGSLKLNIYICPMEIRKEVQELFDKAKALKGKQVLHTSFGPGEYYVIRKEKKGFSLKEYRNKYSFQKEGTYVSGGNFVDAKELNALIFCHTGLTWYARNVFSGKLVHLDNWVKFVNAFKLKVLERTKGETIIQDMYYYTEIKSKKDLEVSN